MKPILFFDLEMNSPFLLEWGAFFIDTLEQESILVKQEHVGSFIRKLTGINTEMTMSGKDEKEVLLHIAELFKTHVFAGFAIKNSDLKFLFKRMMALDIPFELPEFLDLQNAEMQMTQYDHTISLGELYAKYVDPNPPETAHRALSDALMVYEVYAKNPDLWKPFMNQFNKDVLKKKEQAPKINAYEHALVEYFDAHQTINIEHITEMYNLNIQGVTWTYLHLIHKKVLPYTGPVSSYDISQLTLPMNYSEIPRYVKNIIKDIPGENPLELYALLKQTFEHRLQNATFNL